MTFKHKQVTTCLRSKGPINDNCGCEHCCLAVCSVCGAWEGGLPSWCPGVKISPAMMDLISKDKIDFIVKPGDPSVGKWIDRDGTMPTEPVFEDPIRLAQEGDVYKHYKGATYRVLMLAILAGSHPDQVMAIYRCDEDGGLFVRPCNEFIAPRFVLVEEPAK